MHKVLSIKKSEEKKVRGQQKNRKQNGALPFQNSGTMNVLSWIDHDNEGDARAMGDGAVKIHAAAGFQNKLLVRNNGLKPAFQD